MRNNWNGSQQAFSSGSAGQSVAGQPGVGAGPRPYAPGATQYNVDWVPKARQMMNQQGGLPSVASPSAMKVDPSQAMAKGPTSSPPASGQQASQVPGAPSIQDVNDLLAQLFQAMLSRAAMAQAGRGQ